MTVTDAAVKKASLVIAVVSVVVVLVIVVAAIATGRPRSPAEDREKEFLSVPLGSKADEWLRFYTAEAHLAGSRRDLETAEFTLEKFKEFGIEAAIETFYVLLSEPRHRSLRMLSPLRLDASLREPWMYSDHTSELPHVDTFNGYSASGNVTAEVVYANYGTFQDFATAVKALEAHGVSPAGKIALVRYGQNFRGLKVMLAEEHGFSGVLIYSDPEEDGAIRGDMYPQGPWRPLESAQRGSCIFLSQYCGDPRTPGYPSLSQETPAVPRDEWPIPSIPVQPLSAADARPFMMALAQQGPATIKAPTDFQGGLGFEYNIRGGVPVMANLDLDIKMQVSPIWNVIGRIAGEDTSQQVVIGNHRDAWVFGAVDPSSGSSALLETARGFGSLLKNGWKPKRNITLCSWDAEEQGLIGSTEWVEAHAEKLRETAVAYLNVDATGSGPNLVVRSSPSLTSAFYNVTKVITAADHQDGNVGLDTGDTVVDDGDDAADTFVPVSMYERWMQTSNTPSHERPPVGRLGSGSDYTPFLQHLGIASTNHEFVGLYGVYHSIYDSYDWVARLGDPGMNRTVAAAKLWGLLTMRLADSKVSPFDFVTTAHVLRDAALGMPDSAVPLCGHVFASNVVSPAMRDLLTAVQNLKDAAESVAQEATLCNDSEACDGKFVSRKLMMAERSFLAPGSVRTPLPLRKGGFYRHLAFAPDLYKGYGAATFPGVVDAIYTCDEQALTAGATSATDAVRAVAAALKQEQGEQEQGEQEQGEQEQGER